MVDDPAAPDRARTEPLSDEEAEGVRRARFGRLPHPLGPETWVAEVEPDSRYDPAELPFDPRQGSDPG